MTGTRAKNSTLDTPRRPAVVAGFLAGSLLILALLILPFVIPAQQDPTRFWLYVYLWIFPILLPSMASLLYLDFCQIRWCGDHLVCHRTLSRMNKLLGGGFRFGKRLTLRYEISEVSLVWEGRRLLLYCDGLGAGIYLGRGRKAHERLAWLLQKGLAPPLEI